MSQFFEILNFDQDIWGNVHYVPAINLISQGTVIKSFYLPSKTNLKNSETRFSRRKTAEESNAKTNVCRIYLVPFCSSKLEHFFKFSFREI